MNEQGYSFNPIVYNYHEDITTDYNPEGGEPVKQIFDNSKIDKIINSRYISNDLVLNNTVILGKYKTTPPFQTIIYGPGIVWGTREQKFTRRRDIYDKSDWGRNAGDILNFINERTPWKSLYFKLLKLKL
jgi:hypothetical protein